MDVAQVPFIWLFTLGPESYIPRQLAAGWPIRKYGSPEGTLFPLVKGGVNTLPAKLACGALVTPPLFAHWIAVQATRFELVRGNKG